MVCIVADKDLAAVRKADMKAWALDLVSAAVKKIVGQDLAAEAPLMSAGLDSLGAFPSPLCLHCRAYLALSSGLSRRASCLHGAIFVGAQNYAKPAWGH